VSFLFSEPLIVASTGATVMLNTGAAS
jgi:hypothetical protein